MALLETSCSTQVYTYFHALARVVLAQDIIVLSLSGEECMYVYNQGLNVAYLTLHSCICRFLIYFHVLL